MSFYFFRWMINKKNYCTVFDAQWGSSEDKKKSSYYEECTSWKNEMSSVTIYHGTSKDSGQKNFCSTNSTDFQIDWILTVFDVHLHQQKTVATKQIFKNNFFYKS